MEITKDDIGRIVYLPEWRSMPRFWEYWIVKIHSVPDSNYINATHIGIAKDKAVVHWVRDDILSQEFFENAKFITLKKALYLGCPVKFFTPVEIAQYRCRFDK